MQCPWQGRPNPCLQLWTRLYLPSFPPTCSRFCVLFFFCFSAPRPCDAKQAPSNGVGPFIRLAASWRWRVASRRIVGTWRASDEKTNMMHDGGGGGGVELAATYVVWIASSCLHWGASSSATCDAPSALLCSAPARLTSTGTCPVPGLLFSDGLVAPKLTGCRVCANHRCCSAASCVGAYAKPMYPYIRAFAAHIPPCSVPVPTDRIPHTNTLQRAYTPLHAYVRHKSSNGKQVE